MHLDYTFQDKVSKAVIEARQKNQNIMIKIMYMNNIAAATNAEKTLLRHFKMEQDLLLNEVFMKTNMNGVDFLLGQLEKPTLGCQQWLDASAFRPPGYYLVLPQGLQQVNSQYHLDSMPLGWHTAKILYRKYKSKKEMTKVRAIQRYKLPNFDLINGNGIVERIQLLVDPVEIADYQDPVES